MTKEREAVRKRDGEEKKILPEEEKRSVEEG